jgi:hypothetical protein
MLPLREEKENDMKTFTIHGAADDGGVREALRIRTHISERAPRLTIGDERHCFTDLHVSTNQRTVFLNALDSGVVQPGPTGMAELWLKAASFNGERLGQEPKITPFSRRIPSDVALVHVEVPSAPDGRLWFEATSYSESVERGRVTREHHPFPCAGVEPIAIGQGQDGEPQALFRMLPAASFRICRNGRLPPELSPVLVVVWTGSTLRCFAPAKFRPMRAAAA